MTIDFSPAAEGVNQTLAQLSSSEFWSYLNPVEYCPQWLADMQFSSAFGTDWAMPEVGFDGLTSAAASMSPDFNTTLALAALSVTAVGSYYGFNKFKNRKAESAQAQNNTQNTTVAPEDLTKVLSALELEKASSIEFRGKKMAQDRWAKPEAFKEAKTEFAKFLASDSDQAVKVLNRLKSSKEIEKALLQEMNNHQVRAQNPYPVRTRTYKPSS